jgi:hypothetical protein
LKTTFTDADLPQAAACLPLWNKCYIPLLCDWAGTRANPWNYQDAKLKDCLQIMWDIMYPHIPADIQPKKARKKVIFHQEKHTSLMRDKIIRPFDNRASER